MKKYKIIGENIYNFSKKIFIIGVSITIAQVIICKELKSGKIIRLRQNSN